MLDACGDDAGIVVIGYGFNILLWAIVCLVFAAVFEVRCLHHDLNGLAWWYYTVSCFFSRRDKTGLRRFLPKKPHFSR